MKEVEDGPAIEPPPVRLAVDAPGAPRTHGRETLAALAIGLGAMAFLQSATPLLCGNDSYYHVRMARMLPSVGFLKAFPWLHWTFFRDSFVSHHHGFHVLLLPFVWLSDRVFGDVIPGGKAFVIIVAGLIAVMVDVVLRTLGARYRLMWVGLLCALPWHFWLRMSYVRAPLVALPLLLTAVLICIRNRPVWMGLLAFIFTHVYGGFVLVPLVPISFLVGRVLSGEPWRPPVALVAAAMIGGVAGFVINPYFPGNVSFLWTQIFDTGLGARESVGNEWKSFDAWFLFLMSVVLVVVWLMSLIWRMRSGIPLDGNGIGLLLLNAGFLALTIKARRFVEYWPVFALLNAADMATPRMRFWMPLAWSAGRRDLVRMGQIAAVALVAAAGMFTLWIARANIQPPHDHAALGRVMQTLAKHSEPGDLVLTDDWDIFPACFFFNQRNYYCVGLDPVFTQARYPELWERYRIITRAEAPANLASNFHSKRPKVRLEDIADEFQAKFVLVEHDHPGLYHQLKKRTDLFAYLSDDDSTAPDRQPEFAVFRVLPGADTTTGPATPPAGRSGKTGLDPVP